MTYERLQSLIGTAVIDAEFCRALLNGGRCQAIESFHLTPEEAAAVMAIRANNIEQFAAQVHHWILDQQNAPEPPPLVLPDKASSAKPESGVPSQAGHSRARTPALVS